MWVQIILRIHKSQQDICHSSICSILFSYPVRRGKGPEQNACMHMLNRPSLPEYARTTPFWAVWVNMNGNHAEVIWCTTWENVPLYQMRTAKVQISVRIRAVWSGHYSSIYTTVSINSLSRQRRPRSACENAQTDPDPRCLQIAFGTLCVRCASFWRVLSVCYK